MWVEAVAVILWMTLSKSGLRFSLLILSARVTADNLQKHLVGICTGQVHLQDDSK